MNKPAPTHTPEAGSDRDDHAPQAIRERLSRGPSHSYLRDFVYGAIDGAVTTFAVVAGVAGAQLPAGIVIVLGIANLIADGFSMAASNFLGTRAEKQERDLARAREEQEILTDPEGEREEIRQIFALKGLSGQTLEEVVDTLTSDPKRWVEVMMTEEHGYGAQTGSAIKAALMTFGAFVVVGAVPLVSYLLNWVRPETLKDPFWLSAIMTGVAFFAVGATKSRFVAQRWIWSGLETLLIGGVAASFAYVIGMLLKNLVV